MLYVKYISIQKTQKKFMFYNEWDADHHLYSSNTTPAKF